MRRKKMCIINLVLFQKQILTYYDDDEYNVITTAHPLDWVSELINRPSYSTI
jgi:hypothetical protein